LKSALFRHIVFLDTTYEHDDSLVAPQVNMFEAYRVVRSTPLHFPCICLATYL